MREHNRFKEKISKLKYKNAASAIGSINRAAREGKISEGMRNSLVKAAQERYSTNKFPKPYLKNMAGNPEKQPRKLRAFVWSMAPISPGVIVIMAKNTKEAQDLGLRLLPESVRYMVKPGPVEVLEEGTVMTSSMGALIEKNS